ncbi:hypothetical protein NHQ30_001425 [Ciborinia camelliae]|nr:hypothetical protein NHQ30_001425 [Ciborinia camelliae]
MAPAASVAQATNKVKRPMSIQTNGINSSTSSPSPSMSAGRLPSGPKHSTNSATSNGGGNSAGIRSANRNRQGHALGRSIRNNSASGVRSGSVAGEFAIPQIAQSQPYVKTERYILNKYRKNPPSIIIHLHATHFRFDQQPGSFSYVSPMRVLLEHIRQKTIPHELVDFFILNEVPFYEGCMIVQILDHKSIAPQPASSQPKDGSKEGVSIHTLSSYITPSPYASYPKCDAEKSRNSREQSGDGPIKSKTSAQQDKENMPAPGAHNDSQRGKASSTPVKSKVTMCVLFPTPISAYIEIARNSTAPRTPDADVRQDRSDGSTSATLAQPSTPLGAVPPTPGLSMPPPAKRLKQAKLEFNCGNIYAAEAQIILATTAPLALEPANSAIECSRLLESLTHPMHSEKPPQPKSRKRTIAEMAADEALAADEQRYMLILDEQRSATVARGSGGTNVADGAGQPGGGFEARFERFNALANIRKEIAEKQMQKKIQEQETERKSKTEQEVQRQKEVAEARQKDVERRQVVAARQQEAQRRALAAQQQQQQHPQALQGIPPQAQGPHAHPSQTNGVVSNAMQAQRFHPHQGTQAQMSSPIVRNGTPHSQASPTVNNGIGNNPMQHSTSSMGGSPPRPGSVVHQNHPQMGAPVSHVMVPQRSQQSHAGTPRMHNATPNTQSTPLNRGLTPRMSQGSPLQGVMAQAPAMGQMGMNATQAHVQNLSSLTPAQNQQYLMQLRAQQQAQQQAQSMGAMLNGQQMTPQQIMQHQHMRQMQMQANANNNPNHQLTQGYQNQLAAMRQAGMPPNMNINMNQQFMGNNMNMQNMQNMAIQQQLQQQQLQQQQQQQQHAQHPQQQQQSSLQQNQIVQQYMANNPALTNQQLALAYKQIASREQATGAYPQGLPDHAKKKIQSAAHTMVFQLFKARLQQAGIQNGMGMGRQQPGI